MLVICEIDAAGVWTGRSREVGEADGAPQGWVFAAPPVLPAERRARWSLGGWVHVSAADADAARAPSLRAELQLRRAAMFQDKVDAGFLTGGLHVQIDDGSRANLTGMALTASLALQGVTEWPEDYARGWVTVEGERIALPTPLDGIPLAAAAGAYYAALVQFDQDLNDAITAAPDLEALSTIDVAAGWPG